MAKDNINEPKGPITEPVIVQEAFVTEMVVEGVDDMVRFVGSVQLPEIEGSERERRIQARVTMPVEAARKLWRDLGAELKKRSH